MFDISKRVVIITGGYGVLGASMARCMARLGARIVIVGRREEKGLPLVEAMCAEGGEALFCKADVLDRPALEAVRDTVVEKWGRIDVLINAAGGNMPGATIPPDKNLFDLDVDAYRKVLDLNLVGTVIPTLVFGEQMARQSKGSVINISSMSSQQIITRVCGYSSSKAAIDNFTKWCAVDLAKKFGEGVRVNAIAPGFFITEQNRTLLTNPDGSYTDRAKDVVRNTPFGRMGDPEELNGAVVFYASDASRFITGTVLPIDGGFSIFSGV
ncbi:MAG: SDR family oxidoreductase [Rikenellaceae bacterium]|nr:SDR family oxidoreductase [Rikenellaceae bacterium]